MASKKQANLLRGELNLTDEVIDALTQSDISIVIGSLEQIYKNTAGDPAARQMAKNRLASQIEIQKAPVGKCSSCHKPRVPANTEFTCSC